MHIFSNAFEKRWALVFFFMYVLVMVPLPCFFSETYIPSFAGLPLFIFGWTAHTAVTFLLIYVFYRQAMKRPEYRDFTREVTATKDKEGY